MIDVNDPRLVAATRVVANGIAEIIRQAVAAFEGIPPPPKTADGLRPQAVAVRPQNLPSGVKDYGGEIPEKEPDADKPIDANGLKVPTWAQLINLYSECALANYKKNFYPCEKARTGNVSGIKMILRKLGIGLDEKYTVLTRKRIRELEDIGLKEGKSRATIQGWRGYLKSITARWAVFMYEDRGWSVKSIETEPFNMAQKSYVALPQENVRAIDDWIETLRNDRSRRQEFLFVWMMRNLAIRNGDVFRYVWGNFTDKGDKVHSGYVPNKTSKSSQRKATWTLTKEKWMEIGIYKGKPDELVVNVSEDDRDQFQRNLNAEIKRLLPAGRNKGLYELRKLSAHEAYLEGGPKAAVRKTGDSFDTLNTNYVDTSATDED